MNNRGRNLPNLLNFRALSKLLRDDRFWKIAGQAIAAILVVVFAAIIWSNLTANLRQLGINLGFDFLGSQASFDIGESIIPYNPSNSFAQAMLVGLVNSFRVMSVGLVTATIVGLTVGIARLSDNWLVRNLAMIYVEILRNTPLLLQLFFWYFAVFISLPRLESSTPFLGSFYLTNLGIAIPWLAGNPGTGLWLILLAVGILAAVWLWRWRTRVRLETGAAGRQFIWACGAILLIAIIAFIITKNPPFTLDIPRVIERTQIEGGLRLTPEFATLLTGLTLYTASFIAEIVRAGIQSVPQGQWEAGKALGLKSGLMMRLVILPQALRVIIPPLTSQYLNLAKNSSLAVAIGYPDVYFVASTTFNQTGRVVEVMLLIMVTYLTISLSIAIAMNLYNRSVQIKER
ncbi:ABC transporter permease subunit [Kamptonema animale CS-326]|jgi:general L-amino acid transport system permease protein|uniref:amino acid ABC transporter permease n=1 Tax=Kamptonema animale TaxID=92934 RepID=UPI0023310261|nr:ABC transporter permease subunit [Kamptonema animale]MDB9513695.1 ABC transporter permease subunit [Kamptonema animale CS-326]